MNNLINYIREEMATPANTMGAGDPVVSDKNGCGNTPVVTKKKPLKKKAKTKKSEEE